MGLLAAVAAGGALWLRSTSDVRASGSSCADVPVTGVGDLDGARSGVCRTMTTLAEAWGAGDAGAYAAQFTDDATYAAFTGTVYQGRADIEAGHAALFAGLLSGTRLEQRYLSVRLLTPEVAVVLTRGDTLEGDDGDLTKVQTHVLVREADDTWRVAAFHNTQRKPLMERVQFLVEPGSRPRAER